MLSPAQLSVMIKRKSKFHFLLGLVRITGVHVVKASLSGELQRSQQVRDSTEKGCVRRRNMHGIRLCCKLDPRESSAVLNLLFFFCKSILRLIGRQRRRWSAETAKEKNDL